MSSLLIFMATLFMLLISTDSATTFQDLNTNEMYRVEPCFDHWDLLRFMMPPGKPMVMIDIGANKGNKVSHLTFKILLSFY